MMERRDAMTQRRFYAAKRMKIAFHEWASLLIDERGIDGTTFAVGYRNSMWELSFNAGVEHSG